MQTSGTECLQERIFRLERENDLLRYEVELLETNVELKAVALIGKVSNWSKRQDCRDIGYDSLLAGKTTSNYSFLDEPSKSRTNSKSSNKSKFLGESPSRTRVTSLNNDTYRNRPKVQVNNSVHSQRSNASLKNETRQYGDEFDISRLAREDFKNKTRSRVPLEERHWKNYDLLDVPRRTGDGHRSKSKRRRTVRRDRSNQDISHNSPRDHDSRQDLHPKEAKQRHLRGKELDKELDRQARMQAYDTESRESTRLNARNSDYSALADENRLSRSRQFDNISRIYRDDADMSSHDSRYSRNRSSKIDSQWNNSCTGNGDSAASERYKGFIDRGNYTRDDEPEVSAVDHEYDQSRLDNWARIRRESYADDLNRERYRRYDSEDRNNNSSSDPARRIYCRNHDSTFTTIEEDPESSFGGNVPETRVSSLAYQYKIVPMDRMHAAKIESLLKYCPGSQLSLIGELAHQLDRLVVDLVFGADPHDDNGATVKTIPRLISTNSINPMTGRVNSNLMGSYVRTFESTLDDLAKYGYKSDVHPDFTIAMVQKYGLLPDSLKSDFDGELFHPGYKNELKHIVLRRIDNAEMENMNIIIDCLASMSQRRNRPMIVWD